MSFICCLPHAAVHNLRLLRLSALGLVGFTGLAIAGTAAGIFRTDANYAEYGACAPCTSFGDLTPSPKALCHLRIYCVERRIQGDASSKVLGEWVP
jgi:hypothetical protein